jgi:hypothetical protein
MIEDVTHHSLLAVAMRLASLDEKTKPRTDLGLIEGYGFRDSAWSGGCAAVETSIGPFQWLTRIVEKCLRSEPSF